MDHRDLPVGASAVVGQAESELLVVVPASFPHLMARPLSTQRVAEVTASMQCKPQPQTPEARGWVARKVVLVRLLAHRGSSTSVPNCRCDFPPSATSTGT